jgi:hypothetical protein
VHRSRPGFDLGSRHPLDWILTCMVSIRPTHQMRVSNTGPGPINVTRSTFTARDSGSSLQTSSRSPAFIPGVFRTARLPGPTELSHGVVDRASDSLTPYRHRSRFRLQDKYLTRTTAAPMDEPLTPSPTTHAAHLGNCRGGISSGRLPERASRPGLWLLVICCPEARSGRSSRRCQVWQRLLALKEPSSAFVSIGRCVTKAPRFALFARGNARICRYWAFIAM